VCRRKENNFGSHITRSIKSLANRCSFQTPLFPNEEETTCPWKFNIWFRWQPLPKDCSLAILWAFLSDDSLRFSRILSDSSRSILPVIGTGMTSREDITNSRKLLCDSFRVSISRILACGARFFLGFQSIYLWFFHFYFEGGGGRGNLKNPFGSSGRQLQFTCFPLPMRLILKGIPIQFFYDSFIIAKISADTI